MSSTDQPSEQEIEFARVPWLDDIPAKDEADLERRRIVRGTLIEELLRDERIGPFSRDGGIAWEIRSQLQRQPDVELRWYRRSHFQAEEAPQLVTLSGSKLGALLSWLGRTRPGLLIAEEGSPLGDATSVMLDLEGISDTLRGLATVNLEEQGIETGAVLSTLGSIARELTAKLAAIDEADEVLKKATVRVLRGTESTRGAVARWPGPAAPESGKAREETTPPAAQEEGR